MDFSLELSKDSIFAKIAHTATKLGFPTYVVGGFVRDLLLKRSNKDLDFVCVGSGIKLAQQVAKDMGDVPVTIFKNFGTAMIKVGERELEFVGARKESYREDSRKPLVEDGTLEEDQQRRDFSINAMAISLNKETYGQLVDPFGGIQHLKEKLIKTPARSEHYFFG
jgi:poly(A) polymerase